MLNKLQLHREFYNTGATKDLSFRKTQLKKLKKAIIDNEQAIYTALYTDLKKSKEEAWVTELAIVINEIDYFMKNMANLTTPERVPTNFSNWPSKSYIYNEPLGVVLVIAPWNYPLQLLFNPLIGAMAAGNCVALKSSEHAPATDAVMHKIITETLDAQYVSYHQGNGAAVVPEMMNGFIFDHVFYTGSTAVGKLIYKMAAENLVPVTLELGGKSPCVVTEKVNIKKVAKRIVVSKFSNCGQMCVAPDYVLVHQTQKNVLIDALKTTIQKFYSAQPQTNANYGKVINEHQWQRIIAYLDQGTIVHGGNFNKETLYIEPTLLTDVDMDSKLMNEEIFGPLLPIITYNTMEEAVSIINKNKNPLAFYLFTKSSSQTKTWLKHLSFGGGCVNNTAWHLTNHHLPFGGRGLSGIGAYHGKFSFQLFSHKKSVMKTPYWFDPSIKYPPFVGKLRIFKWIIK